MEKLREKYTLSAAALAQRKEAARGAKGSGVARNAYKHGRYAQSFLTQLSPCLTTCAEYEKCPHVINGTTKAGSTCYKSENVQRNFDALIIAIKDKTYDDLNELAAITMAGAIDVIQKCIQDIIEKGTVLTVTKHNDEGECSIDYKPNPSLLALPKLLADMGLSPQEFLLTPRARSRAANDDSNARTLADMMNMLPRLPR